MRDRNAARVAGGVKGNIMVSSMPLVGKWSAYLYNGYGTMEDILLAFRPDGTGWYAFERHILCERTTFSWSINADGLLDIYGEEYAGVRSNGHSYETKQWKWQRTSIRFNISDKSSQWPNDKRIFKVLTLENTNFAGATEFAFVTDELSELDTPSF